MKNRLLSVAIIIFATTLVLPLTAYGQGAVDGFSYPADAMSNGWQYYNKRSFYYDSNHLGADINLLEKTPIKAIAKGKVVEYSNAYSGYGELVVAIEHELPIDMAFKDAQGNNKTTRYILSIYGHVRKSQERNGTPLDLMGKNVERGQVIGYVNNSSHPDGISPDPNGDGFEHLHLGIRLSNAATAKDRDKGKWLRGYRFNVDGSDSGMQIDFADPITVIGSHYSFRHPAGSLVKTSTSSNLYVLFPSVPGDVCSAMKKVLIPSSSFGSEGINTSKAITITQKEMDSYVDAGSYAMLNKDNYPTIFRGNGDFLFKIGTPVYLYDKSAGKKRRVYTDKAMFSWGYGWSNVASSGPSYAKNATDGEPLYYRDGALVRGQSNSAVYVLENGYKRAFQTYDIFAALGCKDANIVWLSDYDINNNVGIKGAGQMLTSTNIWQSGEYPLVISAGVYPPQNLAIVSVTMSSVNLSWQDNQNSGAAYKVFRANSGNTIEYATGITALSFTDNSVTKGQTKGKIFF